MSQPCTLTTCSVSTSPYGYRPSQEAPAIFIAISSVCLIANAATTVRASQTQQQKHSATVPFAMLVTLACALEVIGWADRLAGWSDPWAMYPFMQGKALLTIAPVFLTSSIYVSLGPMVHTLGTEHSILPARLYAALLLPADLLALALQLAGLALSSSNAPSAILTDTKTPSYTPTPAGAKLVTAGLALQLATLIAAALLLASVLVRAALSYRRYGYTTFHRDAGYVPLPRRFRIFTMAVPSAMAVLFGRLCFRVAEYAGGVSAKDGEGLFVGLEGLLVAYALVALVGCHPGLFLRDGRFVSRIEAEALVGIDAVGSGPAAARMRERERENEAGLEELRKVYRAHVEEEQERYGRFER
ncbi:Sphingoid long-chain base transporter RSB1 [Colletotrichum tropicale]|nr:Sphingoid long-chain base transporter RSB1 [Colletotrichum tropicale]